MFRHQGKVGLGGVGALLVIASVIVIAAVVFGMRRDRFTVAVAGEAPYGYRDTETGRVTGEGPEMARAILERIGVEEIEFIVTDWKSLIPGLNAGKWDMVAAGMYITPKRAEKAAFSNPTYQVSDAFIVQKGNPKDLHSFEDVAENEDAVLGIMTGTAEKQYALDAGVPEDRIQTFTDNAAVVAAVKTGRVDAFAGTRPTVMDWLKKDDSGRIEEAQPFRQPEIKGGASYGAFTFPKDTSVLQKWLPEDKRGTGFVKLVNRELEKFIGTKEHQELVNPFGFNKKNLPGDVTAEELSTPDATSSDEMSSKPEPAETAPAGGE